MCMENLAGPQTVQVPNYSGVNIQIFNPTVAAPGTKIPSPTVNTTNYTTNPGYPANYYTQNLAQSQQVQQINSSQQPQTAQPVQSVLTTQYSQEPTTKNPRKTEFRSVVELSDNYIKNVETYLNSQDKEIRLIGAKEVLDRLEEDPSRNNDEVLTTLVNKMLQDPYQPIKFMAIGILESKSLLGNAETMKLLQGIQKLKTQSGGDELKAANALLKMSSTETKKEFDVTNESKSEK